MGCCASTNHKSVSDAQHHRRSSAAARSDNSLHSEAAKVPAAPPTPEEETVKEVLSETPAPKPTIPKIQDEEKKKKKSSPLIAAEEVSEEVSEICSLSESVSTATEKREDDGGGEEVRQRRVNRSPAKFRNRNRTFSGERRERTTAAMAAGKSPGRKSEPSPGRVRLAPGRERRAAADGRKRDSGECSGRRSKSPATRAMETEPVKSGTDRSPSDRKMRESPGRVRSELPEKARKFEERENSNNEMSQWLPPTTNESLENPLVSLECFIFL